MQKNQSPTFQFPIGLALIICTLIVCATYELHQRWEKTITPKMRAEIQIYHKYENLPQGVKDALRRPPLYGKKFFATIVDPNQNQVSDALLHAGAEPSTKDEADYIVTQAVSHSTWSPSCSTKVMTKAGSVIKVIDNNSERCNKEVNDMIEGLSVQNRAKVVFEDKNK